jgi:signal transduction histidine kinase
MERPMTHKANGRISSDNDQPVPLFSTMHLINTSASVVTHAELPQQAQIRDACGADEESIREDERKRIARDIHDELGQQILVLRMDVLRLRDVIAETHPKLHAVVGDVLLQLDTTMQSVRAVIRGLRPAVLDLGLRAAAEWQCSEFTRRSGIACDMAWKAGEITMIDRYATALFRTLQESLTNVHRHAQASRVRINVNIDNKHIVMTVSDNGIGSAPADQVKTNSFGLSCMRERITALGGKLAIDGAVHEGMTLTVSLPV